ncbi:MAG TPA: hypothetical protein VJ301_11700 [Propionibacteriaceae bacterium]|nr:hypothetical protein [Propionibacteriaceae bacterium]
MARIIRETSGYGAELAGFFFRIMRGEAIPLKNRRMPHVPTLDQRINAAAWLADRGWGKAKETIELTGEASPQERVEILRRLSEDERAQLRALLSRALESNDTSISIESNTAEPQNAPSAGASELEAIPPVESGS